jgi:ABC-type uncharacterized transport system permease subunit
MMSIIIISIVAISLYLTTAGWIGYRVFKLNMAVDNLKNAIAMMGGIALIAHATVLYQQINTVAGWNLGFYNALSLMSWVIALLVVFVSIIKPAENLAIVFLPAASLALLLEMVFPSEYVLSDTSTIGLRIHILFSVSAYALLSIAALQSVLLAVQEKQLRNKHPVKVMHLLPPMQMMEELLVQLIAIGFFLLSMSLASGMVFVHDIFAQDLAHKTILSMMAWIVFAIVLWGRWANGWRGKQLIRWTLGGFILLMLAYFGSKMVYELILQTK